MAYDKGVFVTAFDFERARTRNRAFRAVNMANTLHPLSASTS